MSDNRPRYVPSRNRRKQQQQQQQRFHGAFTGGFSAGFFNTVGSKEGWKPRNNNSVNDNNNNNNNNNNNHDDEDDDERVIEAQDYPINNNNKNEGGDSASKRQKRPQPQQRLEDFMDEQDHDEWGGPTQIKQEFDKDSSVAKKGPTGIDRSITGTDVETQNEAFIGDYMKMAAVIPPANVGHRLLRVLGWREGNSAAYVPAEKILRDPLLHVSSGADATKSIPEVATLSKKRLRKVQLQQKRVTIPPPKLDTCGLGFEPYQNAPEFRDHQEKRKKQAQQRAQLRSGPNSLNVYRVSDVVGNNSDDDPVGNSSNNNTHGKADPNNLDDEDNAYISYETMEDFVGHKSVSGFALREDADDAYDDDQGLSLTKVTNKVRLDAQEYNTEIYEHHSSDDEPDTIRGNHRNHAKLSAASSTAVNNIHTDKLAGVLSSFANTGPSANTATTNSQNSQVFAADGRPPLAGFVMGGAFASHSMPKRYRGPDIPSTYDVKRHEFGPNEHPSVLNSLSHAMQLEMVDEKRQQAMDEALRINASSNRPSRQQFEDMKTGTTRPAIPQTRSKTAMAGGNFAGLAEAMKNRFTSVKEDTTNKPQAGIRIPSKEKGQTTVEPTIDENPSEQQEPTTTDDIKITRTMHPFIPHRLLCKRFHVPVPVSSSSVPVGSNRVTESSYFEQEILNPATQNQPKDKSQPPKTVKPSSSLVFDQDGVMKDEAIGGVVNEASTEERPSMETYKSIFEPQSDDDDTNSESDEGEGAKNTSEQIDDGASKTSLPQQLEASNDNTVGEVENNLKHKDDSLPVGVDDTQPSGMEKPSDGVMVPYEEGEKKRKREKKHKRGEKSSRSDKDEKKSKRRHRKKRSRSVSSESTDLSRDSTSTEDRKDRKRRRDRKEKKKRKKHKSSKKSKRED